MKRTKRTFLLTTFLAIAVALSLAGCRKPGDGAQVGGSSTAKFPSEIRPGLIMRYNKGGLKDSKIVYVQDVDKDAGNFTLHFLKLSDESDLYWYETRILSLANLESGHLIHNYFNLDGGTRETSTSALLFFGSKEMLKDLNGKGSTPFSTDFVTRGSGPAELRRATRLRKVGTESVDIKYNGAALSVPALQAETETALGSTYPVWFHNEKAFPLIMAFSESRLAAVDDLNVVAAKIGRELETKSALLTGSLFFGVYNLSGSATRHEFMEVSKDIWVKGIQPVVQKSGKKCIVEVFTVQPDAKGGSPSVTQGSRRELAQVVKNLEAFLVRTSGLPKDKLVVKAAVSTEGLPADLSPIGRDPEIRIFVHLE